MKPNYLILVVEDDDSDFFLLERAFRKNNIQNPIVRVKDGLEGLHYLQGSGDYTDREKFPFPDVIILDLKTPRMSGMELLAWIRDHPDCRVIPTVIMSSSQQDVDVSRAYELGANTYFVKPTTFEDLIQLTNTIQDYWRRGAKPSSSKKPR
ncbi:MAG: response regulator [Verrucomicrobiales bacterium]|nr:response regulator [Verrucomicrobiales bacterium]